MPSLLQILSLDSIIRILPNSTSVNARIVGVAFFSHCQCRRYCKVCCCCGCFLCQLLSFLSSSPSTAVRWPCQLISIKTATGGEKETSLQSKSVLALEGTKYFQTLCLCQDKLRSKLLKKKKRVFFLLLVKAGRVFLNSSRALEQSETSRQQYAAKGRLLKNHFMLLSSGRQTDFN